MRRGEWLMAAALAGCGGPDGGGDDGAADAAVARTMRCELGRERGGAFVPLGEDDRAELVLGFQGFLFFEVNVRTSLPAPTKADALFSVTLDDRAPFGATQIDTWITSGAEGHAMSDAVIIFLDGSGVGAYTGKTAEVAIRLDGEGATCTASGRVRLVDEDPCVHTGDTPDCP